MAKDKPTIKKEVSPKVVKETKVVETPKVAEPQVNMDEIIAKAVADALEKQKQELMTQVAKPEIKKARYGFIPDHARVRIHTNVDGKFIINDTRGQNFFIELNGYKDNTTIAFKDLKNFYGKNYTLFTSGKLAISDVLAETETELKDVISDLNLTKIYYDENKVSPIDIEELFSDETSVGDFEFKLKNSTEVAETIVEVGYILYRQGLFSNNNKMNVIRQLFRDPNLFTK